MSLVQRYGSGPPYIPIRLKAALLLAILLVRGWSTQVALAHSDQPTDPSAWLTDWHWEPMLVLSLGLTGWLYGRGVRRLWAQAGRGRGVKPWQVVAFALAWLTLVVALLSPLDGLAATRFSGHMGQHLLLILVAAPLTVVGAPTTVLLWGLPRAWRPQLGRWWHRRRTLRHLAETINGPLAAWLLHALTLWLWHLPALYGAALQTEWIHILEHGTLFGTALLFWWQAAALSRPASPTDRRRSATSGSALLATAYLFTTALHSGLLGALITFSGQPWYPLHAARTAAINLNPLADQQLAGVIMWVPAGVVYLASALLVLGRWLHTLEQRDEVARRTNRPMSAPQRSPVAQRPPVGQPPPVVQPPPTLKSPGREDSVLP